MLKSVEDALKPDPRFTSTWGVDGPMTFADHHEMIAALTIPPHAPDFERVVEPSQRMARIWALLARGSLIPTFLPLVSK